MKDVVHREIDIGSESVESIWPCLRDVDLLSSCSSAIKDVAAVEPDVSWSVVLKRRVGRFEMSAPLQVEIAAEEVGRRIAIVGRGIDRKMGARLEFDAALTVADGAAADRLSLELSYEMTGQLASLGSGVIRRHASELVDEFCTNLAAALTKRSDR